MKRILLLAAALGCMSLWSCDNEQDLDDLSPADLEMMKLDELIASQSEFDEESFIEDLLNGVFISKTAFIYREGECVASSFDSWDGPSPLPEPVVFFEDGTCKVGTLNPIIPPFSKPIPFEFEYTWRYDSATRSIITNTSVAGGEIITSIAKIRYYKDHTIIWEGDICATIGICPQIETWGDYMRTSGYIDMESREQYIKELS